MIALFGKSIAAFNQAKIEKQRISETMFKIWIPKVASRKGSLKWFRRCEFTIVIMHDMSFTELNKNLDANELDYCRYSEVKIHQMIQYVKKCFFFIQAFGLSLSAMRLE